MPAISYDRRTVRRVGDTVTVRIRHDLPHALPPVTDSTLRLDRIEKTLVMDCRRKLTLRQGPAGYYLEGRAVRLGPLPAGAFVDIVAPAEGQPPDPIADTVCRTVMAEDGRWR